MLRLIDQLYLQMRCACSSFLMYNTFKTGQKPETDYIILRSRLSAQKRDVERALTRFVAKTGKSHPLLPDDKNAFPCKLFNCIFILDHGSKACN